MNSGCNQPCLQFTRFVFSMRNAMAFERVMPGLSCSMPLVSDEDLATQAERDAVPEELLRNVALQGFLFPFAFFL